MITNKFSMKIFLILVFIPSILCGEQKTTRKIITYPRSHYRLLNKIDNHIMRDIETLHDQLQESIIDNATGKIEFSLKGRDQLEDIHIRLKIKDFYHDQRIIKKITDEFKKALLDSVDGILFVTLEESSVKDFKYKIQAKIVNLIPQIIAEGEFEIDKSDLKEQLNSKLNKLAKNLINILIIKEYRNFDTHQFLNFSTLSSFSIFSSSIIWYSIENCNVHNSYAEYKKANSYEDATKVRIKTEKSLSRRNVARNIALISGTSLVFFLLRDCLWHPSIKNAPRNNRAENKKFENINPTIYCSIQNESILINMQLNF